MMNVFINKQCDKPLIYTTHAVTRSEERNAPLPKYIPLNAICSLIDIDDGGLQVYTLTFDYFGRKYVLVVLEDMCVKTVYRGGKTNLHMMFANVMNIQKPKSKPHFREYPYKQGKYKHREIEELYMCA
jgi:hypothetical protein